MSASREVSWPLISAVLSSAVRIETTREKLEETLRSYDEASAADMLPGLPQSQLSAIFERAGEYAPEVRSLPKALALAAVEVLEGEPRALKRSRRRSVGSKRARPNE